MAVNMSNLVIYYTGGGSNSTLSASIGGAISSSRVLSQTVTGTGPTGVTFDDAEGNSPGVGTLTFTASTKTLQWQPFGGSVGTAVDVSTDGSYFIQGASNGGGLFITVVAASLPTANGSYSLTIANRTEKMFLNVSKDDSDAGKTFYHCFAIKNTHASEKIKGVKLYISENTPGADTMTLYLDPLAVSNGAVGPTAVANENTAPSGSTFVAPDSETHASALAVGDLLTSEVKFFWVKELIPANVTEATTNNTFKLGRYGKF